MRVTISIFHLLSSSFGRRELVLLTKPQPTPSISGRRFVSATAGATGPNCARVTLHASDDGFQGRYTVQRHHRRRAMGDLELRAAVGLRSEEGCNEDHVSGALPPGHFRCMSPRQRWGPWLPFSRIVSEIRWLLMVGYIERREESPGLPSRREGLNPNSTEETVIWPNER